jgi:hypothetical protein
VTKDKADMTRTALKRPCCWKRALVYHERRNETLTWNYEVSVRFLGTSANELLSRDAIDRDRCLVWISAAGQVFGDGENPLNVRNREKASFAVAGHFGLFAGFEPPADGVGIDTQKRAEIPGPIVVLLGDS